MRYYSSLAGNMSLAVTISDSATQMSLDTTAGLPSETPFTLVVDAGAAGEEVVEVTELVGLTATITRGIDGTIPVQHNAGAEVRHMASARDFQEPQEHMAATDNVHGVTGDVVGTSDVQELTGKTIDGDENTLTNIDGESIKEGSIPDSALAEGINADTIGGVHVFVQAEAPEEPEIGDVWIPIASS